VKAEVVDALAFRRADQHVAQVLRAADDKTFDLVRHRLVEEVADEEVEKKIQAARARQPKERSTYARLRQIAYAQGDEDVSGELAAIIAEMKIDKEDRAEVHLLYEARKRQLRGIADGLLQRVRAGRTLFYGADDLLASAGLALEDDEFLRLALSETRRDQRAEAAASVLGSECVGRMIEAVLEAKKHIRDENGKYNEAAGERYQELLARIAHTSGASLIAAVQARSTRAGNEEMADLADLITRHPDSDGDRGRPFDAEACAAIDALAEHWGNRMLVSADATRSQFASIAGLATRVRSVSLLPLLKRLLDENLCRYRAFREEAMATGWRPGPARDEAQATHTHEYFRAFQAINAPQTATLMRDYLHDQHFGELAAKILAAQWTALNEPRDERSVFRRGIDFSRVAEKRAACARHPAATSAEAEAIFSAIEHLITDEATEEQKKHAVALGIIAAALPHGQRDATIQKVISLASGRSRAALLRNLMLSGESIDIDLVKNGIVEVFEAAKTKKWILWDGYDLGEWLRLLPFANRPSEVFDVVRGLPEHQSKSDPVEGVIAALSAATGEDAEKALFQFADADRRLYASREWREAVLRRGTPSAARQFVELAASGAFAHKGTDHRHMASEIGGLIAAFPELRTHVYHLLKDGAPTAGLTLLSEAVAEYPDTDGLLLLIKLEIQHNRSFMSWRTIESLVTEHVPSEDWQGAYNIVPVAAVDVRRKLLVITADGGPMDAAARCLRRIDEFRDDYGVPDSEPRHPDLASGRPWPIMIPADD
jgi:hypothetical protein